MNEVKFKPGMRPARLFHVRIREGNGEIEVISANELAPADMWHSTRNDVMVWTIRDLAAGLRLWLGHTKRETVMELWRAAKPATDKKIAYNRPLISGTDKTFAEWQLRQIAEATENRSFCRREGIIPDAWGDRVCTGKALHVLTSHRDSDFIALSNYDVAMKAFAGLGESAQGAQWDTIRYGSDMVGHVDHLFVAADSDAARIAQVIAESIEHYSILDDDDVSMRGAELIARWEDDDAALLQEYMPDLSNAQADLAALVNALSEGDEYDAYGDGNDYLEYRVSVHEMAERFGLEMDEEDVERVRRLSYGTFADEPVPLDSFTLAHYTSFEQMFRHSQRIARRQKRDKGWASSQTKKGIRLVLTGNTGFIVRNGLVYTVPGRYAAQEAFNRMVERAAQKGVQANG